MKTKTNTTEEQMELPSTGEGEGKSDAFTRSTLAERVGETPEGVTLTGTGDAVTVSRLQAENEQLRTQILHDKAHRKITGELERAGARSPGLLFDSVKGDLQFDGDEIVNAAALVTRLKTAFPEQFGFSMPGSIDGGAGVNAEPRLTRDGLAKMKASEIAALDWNDVRRVLAG